MWTGGGKATQVGGAGVLGGRFLREMVRGSGPWESFGLMSRLESRTCVDMKGHPIPCPTADAAVDGWWGLTRGESS